MSLKAISECSNDSGQRAEAEMLEAFKGDALAQIAVVDGRWTLLTVNSAWAMAARLAGHVSLTEPGTNLVQYLKDSPTADPCAVAVVLRGVQEIDSGAAQFVSSYRSSVGNCQFQVSISVFEAGGRRYSTISRINLTELLQLRAQTRKLSSSLMRAQANLVRAKEDERERVARELHDTAAQHLTGVNLGLAKLLAVSSDPAAIAIAEEIGGLLAEFHRDIRGVTYVLHPPELQRCGLHEAVRALCDGVGRRAGLDVAWKIYGRDRRCGNAIEAAIFRIVQESLANILSHAHARHVRVRLESRDDVFLLVIKDDGVGLPKDWRTRPALGVGVAAMAKRAREFGGRFHIRSRLPGWGTIVLAAIPRHGAAPAFFPEKGITAWSGA